MKFDIGAFDESLSRKSNLVTIAQKYRARYINLSLHVIINVGEEN
jgi:hypothetical protein